MYFIRVGRVSRRVLVWTSAVILLAASEDYLTVLAGQRQWIATTNFAGCLSRPPDSFANSGVLTTSAKFLMRWARPSARAFLCRLSVSRLWPVHQRPFGSHSPVPALPESPALLDLAESPASLHPQSVALPTQGLVITSVGPGRQMAGYATSGRGWHNPAVAGLLRRANGSTPRA